MRVRIENIGFCFVRDALSSAKICAVKHLSFAITAVDDTNQNKNQQWQSRGIEEQKQITIYGRGVSPPKMTKFFYPLFHEPVKAELVSFRGSMPITNEHIIHS